MSARSGRSSVTGGEYRPPSTTPSLRRRTSNVSSVPRPPSTTPGRTSSRNAINRPGSSLSGRQSIGTLNITTSRLVPRKSIADGLADEEGRRRAKTSAEEAAKAEGRITAGSRAHRFLHMNVKDLESKGKPIVASDVFGSDFNGRKPSPTKGRPSSPLKDSLLGTNRSSAATTSLGLPTPKSRTSVGAMGMSSTPRIAKARASLFGTKNGTSTMLPPSLPLNNPNSSVSLEGGSNRVAIRSFEAQEMPSGLTGTMSQTDDNAATSRDVHVRNQMLLEELDLTPKRNSKLFNSEEVRPGSGHKGHLEQGEIVDLGGFALTTNEGDGEEVAQASVPWTLYEESTLEAARLKSQLTEMTQQLQQSKAEVEMARLQAIQEAQQEREEERRVEKDDERRRKKDLEDREKETKETMGSLTKEMKKLTEDAKRMEVEKDKRIKEVTAQLQDTEKLVEDLKGTLESGGANNDEVEKRLLAKDLEMKQLHDRIDRLIEEKNKEREEHLREVDDLKAAGEEAFDIFQREQALSNEIIQETEHKMTMLEARAQEAIVEVERQRDEALQGIQMNSVAEIGHQSLQEQLGQAQKRIVSLEDQLVESNTVMQQERETNIRRKDRFGEFEARLRGDLAKIKAEYKRVSDSEAEARSRSEELMVALEESRAALENERAELEILRTEALVIGSGQDEQSLGNKEKKRLEGEIERLTGLLEGARSGKREASRQAEAHLRECDKLHASIESMRATLKIAEADQSAMEEKLSKLGHSNGDVGALNKALDEKTRHVELLQRTNLPLSEQVSILIEKHRKEISERDDEVNLLRKKLNDALKVGARTSLTVPSGSESSSLQSPTLSGFGDAGSNSPRNSRRLSGNSIQSRKSRGSMGQTPVLSDTMMKEMAGLRSIVNTLNQELTESKVNNLQKEKELINEVGKWREEARKWQLTVESIKRSEPNNESHSAKQVRDQAIENQMGVEKKLQEALEQVQKYKERLNTVEVKRQEEVGKLNQDIADLEALCEATVWRREEQDAKRQELERQVGKLQRSLDRALNGTRPEESPSQDSTLNGKNEITCDDCGETGHRMGDDCPYNKDDLLF